MRCTDGRADKAFVKDPAIAVEQRLEARRRLTRDLHLRKKDFL